MKEKMKRALIIATPLALSVASCAGAVDGDSSSSTVMSIIQQQITSLTSDAGTVIAGAIGISVLFFGAKFLWSKFRSMSK